MSITKHSIFLALLLLSSFIIAKNLSKKSSLRSNKSSNGEKIFDLDCLEVSLDNDKLVAKCKNFSKRVNLNNKLENDDGKLKFKNNGNFSQNCFDCSLNIEEVLEMKTYELRCECLDRRHDSTITSINIDSIVESEFLQ